MNHTTLRMAAARRKLTKAEISTKAELNVRTVDKIYDGIPDDIIVSKLRQVAEALGLELIVEFRERAGR